MSRRGNPLSLVARGPLALRITGVVTALAAIAVASSYAPKGSGGGFTLGYLFNLAHVPLYGFLALQFLLLAGPVRARKPLVGALVVGAVVLAGFLDEWHQAGVPGRDSSIWDLGSDLLGGVLALAFVRWGLDNEPEARAGFHLAALGLTVTLIWGFIHMALPPQPPPFLPAPLLR